jgi:hypothetical protein
MEAGSHVAVADKGPIYIVGLDRTGKTTMRAFLSSHPNISIPAVGSNMWTYFYRQYGDLARSDNFERCLNDMLRYKHVRYLEPDVPRIRHEFAGGPRTYAHLFELFLRHHAERAGKERWGAQTGLAERYARPMFGSYPGLKIVHMVRDPRDRYEASLARWPDGKGRAGGAAARFAYSTRLATANVRRFGTHRYRVVRFEDMISDPDATIRGVCDFLGEEYVPSMMAMPDAPDLRGKMGFETSGTGAVVLSTEYVGRYRERVPPAEIEFIEKACRATMRTYGYAPTQWPTPLVIGWRDRARTWPGQGGRYLAWTGLEILQQRLPRLIRRRPGERMVVTDLEKGSRS